MAPAGEVLAVLGRQAGDNLWQSTAVAAIAAMLALALKSNHARTRYWLWLAASLKFLVPFGLLTAIGARMGGWLIPAAPAPRVAAAMEQLAQPFTSLEPVAPMLAAPPAVSAGGFPYSLVLLVIWLCGGAFVIFHWWSQWRKVAAALRAATPLTEGREIEALRRVQQGGPPGQPWFSLPWFSKSKQARGHAPLLVNSEANLEPGIFGMFRPVLWLPRGIAERLSDAELEAIMAHELCHARRHDNLAAAVHMVIEAVFWFHPLVWWVGARLAEERERACDEEVIALGREPHVYAESILKVCEHYVESPVACVAGVTGGELKRRIESIVSNRLSRNLSVWKKALIGGALAALAVIPLGFGILHPIVKAAGQSDAQLAFEVASFKPATPPTGGPFRSGVFGGPAGGDPGRISYNYMSLARLVAEAYGLDQSQLTGPAWMQTTRFDIEAKIPPGTTKEQVPIMLRNLLADRLKLRGHRESRGMRIYELSVAPGGPKLKSADDTIAPQQGTSRVRLAQDGFPDIPPGVNGAMIIDGRSRWQAYRTTMPDLVKMLTRELRAPVSDATNLTGRYDISLYWITSNAAVSPDAGAEIVSGPLLASALKSQLGLNLSSKNGTGEILVIDSAERTPVEPPTPILPHSPVAQSRPRYRFEVASVKPAPERDYGNYPRPTGLAPAIQGDPAQIIFDDVSLLGVICRAYGVRPNEIQAPAWTRDIKYDIHAKVPADAPKGHIPEMLQNLLADRFQLRMHWETREEPGYALAVGNGGPKLRQSAPETPRTETFRSNGHIELRHVTMSEFANSLTANMSRPVVDRTGLPGEYDIAFDAAPDSMPGFRFASGPQNPDFPTIFAALRLLGLNLTAEQRLAKKYLVVDSASKVPSEN